MYPTYALLWDFDGTLSYPNKSFSSALHAAIVENGFRIDLCKTAEFLETAYSWKTPREIYPSRTGSFWWDTLYGKLSLFCRENSIPAPAIPEICRRFRETLISADNYLLYDDTVETLRCCTELGFQNYIATNNYPEIVAHFDTLGLSPYLSGHIVSSHIGYEKPTAAFYAYAKQLCSPARAVFMIGDNPMADIAGAQAAGLTAIAVHECTESTADHYCQTLSDILPIITKQRSVPYDLR